VALTTSWSPANSEASTSCTFRPGRSSLARGVTGDQANRPQQLDRDPGHEHQLLGREPLDLTGEKHGRGSAVEGVASPGTDRGLGRDEAIAVRLEDGSGHDAGHYPTQIGEES